MNVNGAGGGSPYLDALKVSNNKTGESFGAFKGQNNGFDVGGFQYKTGKNGETDLLKGLQGGKSIQDLAKGAKGGEGGKGAEGGKEGEGGKPDGADGKGNPFGDFLKNFFGKDSPFGGMMDQLFGGGDKGGGDKALAGGDKAGGGPAGGGGGGGADSNPFKSLLAGGGGSGGSGGSTPQAITSVKESTPSKSTSTV